LGAASYGLSIVLYITAAQQLGATRSQLVFSSAPFWGVLLSIVLLGDPFTLRLGVSLALLVGSIALLQTERHGHRHAHAALLHEHLHLHDAHHRHHGGVAASGVHSHPHAHEPLEHTHAHEPDLHHRHDHD
jgi:hypothetical protein